MLLFFQAEDGIRDYKVTGVQTCALPIFDRDSRTERVAEDHDLRGLDSPHLRQVLVRCRRVVIESLLIGIRSEERRVGKECRWRGSPSRERKKERKKDEGQGTKRSEKTGR